MLQKKGENTDFGTVVMIWLLPIYQHYYIHVSFLLCIELGILFDCHALQFPLCARDLEFYLLCMCFLQLAR